MVTWQGGKESNYAPAQLLDIYFQRTDFESLLVTAHTTLVEIYVVLVPPGKSQNRTGSSKRSITTSPDILPHLSITIVLRHVSLTPYNRVFIGNIIVAKAVKK